MSNVPRDLILNYDREELALSLGSMGCPSFRTDQILRWIYEQQVTDWDQMTNLGKALRQELQQRFNLRWGDLAQVAVAEDETRKLLLQWHDGALTETVYMPQRDRIAVCISTQVGCPVRCAFCASGQGGLQRSLSAGEIVEQVLWAAAQCPEGRRLSNVVIMGMGEPLANYDATLKAIRIINASWGVGIGARHITLSTVGLPDQIRRLAEEPYQITLAVSLHAPDDALRAELIPWARKVELAELFAAIGDYYQRTHREVTLEYTLLKDVNCGPEHAEALARWVRRYRCNVNLINYNTVPDSPFRPATAATVEAFADRLGQLGVNVHIRQSRGGGIQAACGQLRRQVLDDQTAES